MSTKPTFRSRSCASSSHGETLPSWSSFVTRISSPAGRTVADAAPGMSTVAAPQERLDTGEGTGLGRPWRVIVLNDDHNTFQGVALALSAVVPGVSYDQGLKLADRIHASGQAIVWS